MITIHSKPRIGSKSFTAAGCPSFTMSTSLSAATSPSPPSRPTRPSERVMDRSAAEDEDSLTAQESLDDSPLPVRQADANNGSSNNKNKNSPIASFPHNEGENPTDFIQESANENLLQEKQLIEPSIGETHENTENMDSHDPLDDEDQPEQQETTSQDLSEPVYDAAAVVASSETHRDSLERDGNAVGGGIHNDDRPADQPSQDTTDAELRPFPSLPFSSPGQQYNRREPVVVKTASPSAGSPSSRISLIDTTLAIIQQAHVVEESCCASTDDDDALSSIYDNEDEYLEDDDDDDDGIATNVPTVRSRRNSRRQRRQRAQDGDQDEHSSGGHSPPAKEITVTLVTNTKDLVVDLEGNHGTEGAPASSSLLVSPVQRMAMKRNLSSTSGASSTVSSMNGGPSTPIINYNNNNNSNNKGDSSQQQPQQLFQLQPATIAAPVPAKIMPTIGQCLYGMDYVEKDEDNDESRCPDDNDDDGVAVTLVAQGNTNEQNSNRNNDAITKDTAKSEDANDEEDELVDEPLEDEVPLSNVQEIPADAPQQQQPEQAPSAENTTPAKVPHVIDLQQLRKIASQGIPDDGSHRAVAWRVLLGYLPANTAEWPGLLEQKRSLYCALTADIFAYTHDTLNGNQIRARVNKLSGQQNFQRRRRPRFEDDEMESSHGNDRNYCEDYHDSASFLNTARSDYFNGESSSDFGQRNTSNRLPVMEIPVCVKEQWKKAGRDLHVLQGLMKDWNCLKLTDTVIASAEQQQRRRDQRLENTKNKRFQGPQNDTNGVVTAGNDDIATTENSVSTEQGLCTPDKSGMPTPDDSLGLAAALSSATSLEEGALSQHKLSYAHDRLSTVKKDKDLTLSSWEDFVESACLLDEIRKDVVRTHPDLSFFLDPEDDLGRRRYAALERILFIWSKYNKGVRYVQGMNEIVGTIYYVLAHDTNDDWAAHAEADTYWLLNTLLSEMCDIFVPDLDDADTGIQGRIAGVQKLLQRHDPQVKEHLEEIGIDPSFFAVRWLTTLLSREFLLPDTIRLWDSMFASTHKDNFLRYVCVTMVVFIRDRLLKGDFSVCLRLLQGYPSVHMDGLLESSRALWVYETQVTLACHRGGISLHQALQAIEPPKAIVMAFGLRGGRAPVPVSRAEQLEQVSEKAANSLLDATQAVASQAQGLLGRANRFFSLYGRNRSQQQLMQPEQSQQEKSPKAASSNTPSASAPPLLPKRFGILLRSRSSVSNDNSTPALSNKTNVDTGGDAAGVGQQEKILHETKMDTKMDEVHSKSKDLQSLHLAATGAAENRRDNEEDVYLTAILSASESAESTVAG